jgi:hypothetical protein
MFEQALCMQTELLAEPFRSLSSTFLSFNITGECTIGASPLHFLAIQSYRFRTYIPIQARKNRNIFWSALYSAFPCALPFSMSSGVSSSVLAFPVTCFTNNGGSSAPPDGRSLDRCLIRVGTMAWLCLTFSIPIATKDPNTSTTPTHVNLFGCCTKMRISKQY